MRDLPVGPVPPCPPDPFDLSDDSELENGLERQTVADLRDTARGFGWRLGATKRDDIVRRMRELYADPASAGQAVEKLDERFRRLLALMAWLGPIDAGVAAAAVMALQPRLPAGWLADADHALPDTDWVVLAIHDLMARGYALEAGLHGDGVVLPTAFADALLPVPELAPATVGEDGLRLDPACDPVRDLVLAWQALDSVGPAEGRTGLGEGFVAPAGGWPEPIEDRSAGTSLPRIIWPVRSLMPPEANAAIGSALGDDAADRIAFWVAVATLSGVVGWDEATACLVTDRGALAGSLGAGPGLMLARLAGAWATSPYGLWDEISWVQAAAPGSGWTAVRPPGPGYWRLNPRRFSEHLVSMRVRVLESVRHWPRGSAGAPGAWVDLADFSQIVRAAYPDGITPDGDARDWHLADDESGEPLRSHNPDDWCRGPERVLFYVLRGPLRWLGLVETATDARGRPVAARLTPVGQAALDAEPPPAGAFAPPEWPGERVVELAPGLARCRALAGLYALADSDGMDDGILRFRFTAESLRPAFEDGWRPDEIVAGFEGRGVPVPDRLGEAITDWWGRWGRVRLYDGLATVELADEILARELLATTDLGRHIVYACGPTVFVVEAKSAPKIVAALEAAGHTPRVVSPERGA